MQEMYYTSQPLERSNLKLTQATFEAMQGRDPAALCVRLAALGFRRAELDHQAAFPRRAGQAQHPGPDRRAAVRARRAAGKIGHEGAARSRSRFRPNDARR